MSDQLFRLDFGSDQSGEASWRLDEQTRDIGRHGIATARAVLAECHARYAQPEPHAA